MAETPAFVCSHIFENTRPILLVSHSGGDWQFMCGAVHGADEKGVVVGMNHLLGRDPTLHVLMDLPADWAAERTSVGAPWERVYAPDEDDA